MDIMDIAERALQLKEDIDIAYEAGKKSEYDAFWDAFQDFGNRVDYSYGFRAWGHEYIRPKYKVNFSTKPTYAFQYCTKLKKIERSYFDFSAYTPTADTSTNAWYYTFNHCEELEHFEDLGLQAGGYYYTWGYNLKLHTIDVMRCREDGLYTSPFANCLALVNLIIEGVIGTNFPIQQSPLSVASLKSVITHLKDYSGTSSEYTYTVTFKASAFAALEAEGATSPHGNTWAEYIDDLKWKLTKI